MTSRYRRCIFFLIDGARPDALEKAVRDGKCPNMEKIFFEKGEFRTASTVFPSTTGPAYAPFLTGCFPATCNLPGIRWFDRGRFGKGQRYPKAFRSYVGIESYLMNRDLVPSIPTLFELARPCVNIFSPINRGSTFWGNKTKLLRAYYWLYAHFTDKWSSVDEVARKMMLKSLSDDPKFMFVVFPGVDEHSHLTHPLSDKVSNAYADVDKALGDLVQALKAKGIYEETLIVASSDHGLSQTHTHLEVWKELDEGGRTTLYHPKVFRKNVDAACMVSGNGMAHLYLKSEDGWSHPMYRSEFAKKGFLDRFLARPEIDQVVTQDEEKNIWIESDRGRATLKRMGDQFKYVVQTTDPFGFQSLPERMSSEEALKETFFSEYPDALVQLAQLFENPRSGDVVVTGKMGFDLRDKHETPEHSGTHGSLHREHMHVPLLSNQSWGEKEPTRTVDIFVFMCEMLGIPISPQVDGVSRAKIA